MKQQIIRCTSVKTDLDILLKTLNYDDLFILTDRSTKQLCLPLIKPIPKIKEARNFTIPNGDSNKNIKFLTKIWKFLSENNATRKSLLINLGGGMLTDMGGFAASTFKRGIPFVNVPTTLLASVDASIGGKTGINNNGLKNEIGTFAPAVAVLIDSIFFKTLDTINLLSGYAEMLKHALLDTLETVNEILCFNISKPNYQKLNDLLFKSVLVKKQIVEKDPKEQGLRKALNLGHTFGHAFESLSYEIRRPIPHGYAVAWGIICELYLSFICLGFDRGHLMKITFFIKKNYGKFDFDSSHYQRLYEFMKNDKKNESGNINFTLLKSIGKIAINQTANSKEINKALDFYKEECF
ncbi:MAG: 3-dehydroquinate synthase [Candidatus Azobacteroides pseudotrichonymphae]|jgi:3-dehydroquinate synthase|nr:3-dehydroquinate synthase [Bacteroidales bacterium OttesenSCG-928-I14]GMO32116.1 MAG: 3-dehydroquinate synthase [Candidatus Azobacteroides pseudotrichonymphae]